MASTGSEAVRFRPRLACLGLLEHTRLEGTWGPALLLLELAVGDGWCMEFVVSKSPGASTLAATGCTDVAWGAESQEATELGRAQEEEEAEVDGTTC